MTAYMLPGLQELEQTRTAIAAEIDKHVTVEIAALDQARQQLALAEREAFTVRGQLAVQEQTRTNAPELARLRGLAQSHNDIASARRSDVEAAAERLTMARRTIHQRISQAAHGELDALGQQAQREVQNAMTEVQRLQQAWRERLAVAEKRCNNVANGLPL